MSFIYVYIYLYIDMDIGISIFMLFASGGVFLKEAFCI